MPCLAPIEANRRAVRKAGMTFTKMPTLSLLKKFRTLIGSH